MPPDFDLNSAMDSVAADLPATLPEPTAASESTAPTAPEAPPEPGWKAYPKTWKPEHSAHWNSLPEAVKEEAQRREDDFHKGLEPYKAKAQMGERLERLLKPHEEVIQRYGLDTEKLLGNLLQAQMQLSLGKPEDRVALIKQLLTSYNIDPATLGGQPAGDAPYIDPTLVTLQSEVAEVKSALNAEQQRRTVELRKQAAAEVESFRADKANDLFDQAANEIGQILKSDSKITLAEAYERATWVNPDTRKIRMEREAKAQAAAAEKAERERAEKAAAATRGSVRTTPRSSSATAPVGTIDETMRETLAAIKSRS